MPFANAPRFEQSSLITRPLSGHVQDASDYGPACPQHEPTSLLAEGAISGLGLGSLTRNLEALLLQGVLKESEDCLNINVQVPKGHEGKKLPVVLWL
jgi:carboxylesterase type B